MGVIAYREADSPSPELIYAATKGDPYSDIGHVTWGANAAESVALAQAWIAKQPDAANYDIVVVN